MKFVTLFILTFAFTLSVAQADPTPPSAFQDVGIEHASGDLYAATVCYGETAYTTVKFFDDESKEILPRPPAVWVNADGADLNTWPVPPGAIRARVMTTAWYRGFCDVAINVIELN